MKFQLTDKITAVISPNDFTTIQEIALTERRKTSDVIRNILEDVVDGKIEISDQAPEPKKHSTAVRITSELKGKIDAFKEGTGLSTDKALHLALAKLRTQPELFAAIDALGQKHRHSNSPRPPTLKDVA